MNERIKELAISDGIYDCLCDPYDKFKTGDYYGSVMWDLERFAEKIVRECIAQASISNSHGNNQWDKALTFAANNIKQHFGVEE